MKDSTNVVTLIGRLGQDPEFKNNQDKNKEYCTFSVATGTTYTNKDGNKIDSTQWHNCIVLGSRASAFNQYVKKGDQIHLIGSIQYVKKDDKFYTNIIIEDFTFLSNKKES